LFPVAGRVVMVIDRFSGSGFLALPVGLALNDEFVGRGLQPVHRRLREE
jgi:hypothetical protein